MVAIGIGIGLGLARNKGGGVEPSGPKLFVFGGQSNMDGVTGSVPSTLVAAMPNVKMWNGSAFVDYQANVNSNTFGDGSGWGPEAEFVYRYTQDNPTETIYVVKYAIRGTRLAADTGLDWNAASVSEYWDTLVNGAVAAKAAIPGGGAIVPAFFWMQGENDAEVQSYAQIYLTNLTALIASMRSRIGSATTKFIMGRIHNTLSLASWPYKAVVRRAHYDASQNVSRVSVINTDAMAIGGDNIHFTASGLVSLGDDMYSAYMGTYVYNGDITPPVITSTSTFSIVENLTAVADLTANKSVVWSIVGGADAARFQFSGSTLSFTTAPDYENPTDGDANNQYIVTVRAMSDSGFTADQTITVTVTDDTNEGGGPTYEPEAEAYFTRMTVQPDATRKGVINTLVQTLKADALFSKVTLYLPGSHDAQAGRLNLTGAGKDLVLVGSPTFVANKGYAGSTGNYLTDGIAFNSHGSQNNQTVFAWALDDPDNSPFFGAYNSASPFYGATAFWTGTQVSTRINHSTSLVVSQANTLGFIAVSKNGTSIIGRSNGTALTFGSQAGTGVPNGAFQVCALNGGASLKTVMAAGYADVSLTATELGNLYAALNAYKAAIGA